MKREYQHQFEISLLFAGHGIETTDGCLKTYKRGDYQNPHIEAAYLGYAMARRNLSSRYANRDRVTELAQSLCLPEATVKAVLEAVATA